MPAALADRETMARAIAFCDLANLPGNSLPGLLPTLINIGKSEHAVQARSRSIPANIVDVLVLKHGLRSTPLGDVQHRTA
jgi:hypothetical protein